MSRGIVLFGINNGSIDYVKLAVIANAFIKKNMPATDVCLITSIDSKEYYEQVTGEHLDDIFSLIRFIPDKEPLFENKRVYRNTRYYTTMAAFKNETRSMIYDLSPFDETLLVDSDFLICNNNLSAVWGNISDILINDTAITLEHKKLTGEEYRLSPFGIKMFWATIIYFKKGKNAKLLFNLVEHIKENWDFYRLSYEIPGGLYRNDYAFSIAIHLLNGFVEGDYTKPLPEREIMTALDTDQFHKITSQNSMQLFINDPKENWKFRLTHIKGINIHCMNKISILQNSESIMGVLNV